MMPGEFREEHPDELLHRARVGLPLSPQERQVRLQHLGACPACRFLEQARGDLLDEVARPAGGHSITELVAATMASFEARGPEPAPSRAAPPSVRAHGRMPAVAAALLCTMAGAALAAHWIGEKRGTQHPSPRSSVAAPSPRANLSPLNTPAANAASPSLSGPPPSPATPAPSEGPAALFARATQARRDGRGDEARRAYARLWQEFPGTLEAQTGLVAYGRWLLDRSEAQPAARAFADYLRAAPHGPLAAEAGVGLAESLELLHDWAGAQRAWQDVRANPAADMQAGHARARIRALDRLARDGAMVTP